MTSVEGGGSCPILYALTLKYYCYVVYVKDKGSDSL